MADKKGIIYFRLNNPLYDGDATKNCGLSGTEIDKNFNFLRGSDIASGAWDSERKVLVLKRLNGEVISIDGINFDTSFSLEGSSFSPESGGTLSLIVNGGEPYLITGMTESCSAATIILENYVTNEKFEGLEEDVTALAEEYFRLSADLEESKNSFNESIVRLREEVEQNFCELRELFNSHIAESNRKFQELDESLQNLTDSTENRFSQINDRIYQALNNISTRFSEIENSLSNFIEGEYHAFKFSVAESLTFLSQRITEEIRNRREANNAIFAQLEEEREAREQIISQLEQTQGRISENISNRLADIENILDSHSQRITDAEETVGRGEQYTRETVLEEKLERTASDANIQEDIRQKEEVLRNLINEEKRLRLNADSLLRRNILNEVDERANAIRDVYREMSSEHTLWQNADNEIKTRITRERRALENNIQTIDNESKERDTEISRRLTEKFDTVNRSITEAKELVGWYYVDDRSLPHDSCCEVKWGVIIEDVEEGDNSKRRKIILNLDPNDKFLSQCSCSGKGYLSSTITLKYNQERNRIELRGIGDEVVSYINTDIFIQKGFLKNASVSGDYLVLAWENGTSTPTETRIPLTALNIQFTAGNGISPQALEDYEIRVTLGDGEKYLGFDSYGNLITTGIDTAISNAISAESQSIRQYISEQLSEISTRIEEEFSSIYQILDDLRNTKLDASVFNSYADSTDETLSGITQDITLIRERLDNIVLDGDVTALAQRMTYAEENISGLSQDVQENKQDIDFLYTIMEKPGEIIEYPAVNAILAPSGAFEVGTYVNITQTTYTFTNGRYEFGPETNISQIGSPRTGFTQSGVVNSAITVQDSTNLAFRVEIDYTEGASPNTSLGRQSTKPGIPAGTAVGVSNSITGFRRIFFKSTSVTSNTFNESFVKLNANTVKASETNFDISIVGGNREIMIAVPSYRRVVNILDSNFNDTDIKANFATTRCQIGGVSGRYPIEYLIYYYIPDAPFSVNNTYKVTIQ